MALIRGSPAQTRESVGGADIANLQSSYSPICGPANTWFVAQPALTLGRNALLALITSILAVCEILT